MDIDIIDILMLGLFLLSMGFILYSVVETPVEDPPSDLPGICPTDHTCSLIQHPHFENYTIEYNSELNESSSCDEIREFIIDKLEEINPNTFSLRDEPGELTKYDERKKNLIYVLENSSNMRLSDGRNHSAVRFKFCCLEGEDCLVDG